MKTDLWDTVSSPSPSIELHDIVRRSMPSPSFQSLAKMLCIDEERNVMYRERDLAIWCSVYETCGATAFVRLVEEAVATYSRVPIYDWPIRVDVPELGLPCAQILQKVVSGRDLYASVLDNYIEIGSRLTNHLSQHLQRHLVANEMATDDMKEDQLFRDLGL